MKTWKRGRKKATPEQLQAAKERQKIRVKISNLVARDDTIDKKCVICDKSNSFILHNKEKPYYITFICKECRKNKDNVLIAEKYRFNLKEYRKQQIKSRNTNRYLNTRKFPKEEVKEIIEGYTTTATMITLGDYVSLKNISRYQFIQLKKRYLEYFPNSKYIIDLIRNKPNLLLKIVATTNNRDSQIKN